MKIPTIIARHEAELKALRLRWLKHGAEPVIERVAGVKVHCFKRLNRVLDGSFQLVAFVDDGTEFCVIHDRLLRST